MNRFDYIKPASVSEAVTEAARPRSAYLAAGTNMLDLMKVGVAGPERIIDVTGLPGLSDIEWLPDGGVRIGALVRNSDLAYDTRFAETFPMVAEALLSGASAQLRNAATVGGNLMQRTRCAYFLDPASACNKREPGSGCDAREGENRLHAVLGFTEHCIAVHPSDFCVPLVALGAEVEVESLDGKRTIPLAEFHLLPGDTPHVETALRRGELITGLKLPAQAAAFSSHARYLKLRERTSYAFAVVSAAAALDVADGKIRQARIALGGVAAKPWRAEEAEASLVDVDASPSVFARAGEIALAGAHPSGSNAFKIELARRIVARALALALDGTPEAMPALPASPFSTFSGETSGVAHVA